MWRNFVQALAILQNLQSAFNKQLYSEILILINLAYNKVITLKKKKPWSNPILQCDKYKNDIEKT